MPISFMVKEARKHLEEYGFVYTLRSHFRSTGKNSYNYFKGDTKKGDVNIRLVGNYTDKENLLEGFVYASGFNTLKKWLEKAKNSRYLYDVILI